MTKSPNKLAVLHISIQQVLISEQENHQLDSVLIPKKIHNPARMTINQKTFQQIIRNYLEKPTISHLLTDKLNIIEEDTKEESNVILQGKAKKRNTNQKERAKRNNQIAKELEEVFK